MTALDDLAAAIFAAARQANMPAWEIGTIVEIDPGGAADGFDLVTVDWGGTEVPVGRGSTYTPAVGHVVWMARKGGQLMIIDRYVGAPNVFVGSQGES